MGVRTAGIIIIGDEILKGDVRDENTHFLCKRFHSLGVRVCKVSVVSDSLDAIAREVRTFSSNYDLVVTAGGIGPTHDDVTFEGISKAFDVNLVYNDELKLFWKRFYATGDEDPVNKMSKIPETGRVIHVDCKPIMKTKFPLVVVSNVYMFPGIPIYLRAEFSALEKEHFSGWDTTFHNRTIHLTVHESSAISALNRTVGEFDSVQIGSYPVVNNPYFKTRLTLESTDLDEVRGAHVTLLSRLEPQWISTPDDEFLGNAHVNLMNLSYSQAELSRLISDANQTIEQCYKDFKEDEVFISFNGGKDCTALLHLLHSYWMDRLTNLSNQRPPPRPRIQALYIKGQDPFQETEDFIRDTARRYDLDLTVAEGPLKRGLEQLLSGEKSHWKVVLMGTRRTDPNSDNLKTFQETDKDWPSLLRVSPFLDWSYQDIWNLIRGLNIPYCCLYDRGYTSLGSKRNTNPNPELAFQEDGVTKYRPAYTLKNGDSERNGRQ